MEVQDEAEGYKEFEGREADSAGPHCPASAFIRGALLLQEKWVLMIVYSLVGGAAGFSELMRRGGINTTTLTQRLNLLEQAGVLVRTVHSTMPPRTSYALTEAGLALKPVLEAITEWSGAYLLTREAAEVCSGGDADSGLEGDHSAPSVSCAAPPACAR